MASQIGWSLVGTEDPRERAANVPMEGDEEMRHQKGEKGVPASGNDVEDGADVAQSGLDDGADVAQSGRERAEYLFRHH